MISVRLLLAYLPSLALLLASQSGILVAQPQKFEGLKVVNVRFDPPAPQQPVDAEELSQILPLKRDQLLSMNVCGPASSGSLPPAATPIFKWRRTVRRWRDCHVPYQEQLVRR
jgi:hypothetical protein